MPAPMKARSASRSIASTRALEMLVPKNWVATSSIWWASSRMTASYGGRAPPAQPRSLLAARSARSAKKRWWFTTRSRAFSASLRIFVTKHSSWYAHPLPMRVSLDEQTSRHSGSPSGSVASSAMSPVSVSAAHASITGRKRIDAPPCEYALRRTSLKRRLQR